MAKGTKEEAHYRDGRGTRLCGNCAHFHGGSCSIVAGRIEPSYTCDWFQAGAKPGDTVMKKPSAAQLAKLKTAEKKETPAAEQRESAATQRRERKLGIERHGKQRGA